ncbi:hypothetical protein DCAR_0518817 [Daucus carota subsp. sativus]|uniref:Uncharacterized protein n=1 Tax=Daucus carota subsp. sativus TaxID=79200 RepID=A0AAF1B0R9_DAUCS|nr:hypothetical protein DCAR_0518817 [Daucus carota subsp. sativus]
MMYLVIRENRYTSNVESESTRTIIKHWVELFFGVKIIVRRMRIIMGQTIHYIRLIIMLQPGYSIPPLIIRGYFSIYVKKVNKDKN